MSEQKSMVGGTELIDETPVAPAVSKRARKRSPAAKLIQAAALAAVLVPLGSVAAEATPSTCSFAGGGSAGFFACATGPEGGLLFDFGGSSEYRAELRFDQLNGGFNVTIADVEQTYDQIHDRFSEFFPNYQPVPIDPDSPATPYIDFQVNAPGPGDTTWEAEGARGPAATLGYNLWIYWTAVTDPPFSNPRLLHDTDGGSTQFDIDTTRVQLPGGVQCGVFSPCDGGFLSLSDPAVGGRDDMFTSFTIGDNSNSVPEPASLTLLGTGFGAWLYRRRRK